ncbi:acetylornithine deacetylase [Pseudorhodobacter sp. E13]|uniref:acetylornithine deacetylase n=1 Tax=Pseudorhodobacter sp. E13 TaxID=2487931 RepID=UPI000F8D7EF9|nr:acetylornithine deacetylase [Pseudorhodobacter sp. E13]RUS59156.1 acetylornithine deacetylase [Pseudorhodobacter sp. E13]
MQPQTLTAREILDHLVGFRSVSSNSNLDLIDWVERYLASHGVAAHRVYNPEGTKAALFANVGPEVPGGVILSGHSDVVPVEGQDWATDPFRVVEKDGRLYGRGTCDMKGFVALALAAVPLALQSGIKRPLQIAISYDEEVGCTGAPPMIAQMVKTLPKAAAVVVGEPSMMRLVNGHKGGAGYKVHVKGFEVHSSLLPYGVSAIMEAARLVGWINDQNTALQARQPSAIAAMFHPPFTTLHCGKFAGGTAHNITAGDCHFAMEFRVVPDEDEEAWAKRFEAECARVEAAMKAVQPSAAITLDRFFDVPGLRPEQNGAADALVRRLTGDNATEVVSYGTEAGQFQAEGYSCVICGPGDIAQAHQVDEYLELAQFNACWDFMQRLVKDLAE